jgi:hypothetical protein
MSVELPCAAISADAMTVLPDPGGATSTPSSWRASSFDGSALDARQRRVEWEVLRSTGGPLVADLHAAARFLGK